MPLRTRNTYCVTADVAKMHTHRFFHRRSKRAKFRTIVGLKDYSGGEPAAAVRSGRIFPALGATPQQHSPGVVVSCRAPACASCGRSKIYATAPLGPGRQAPYLNAVLLLEADVAPAALLRLLKGLERRAGRRFGPRWGPRCLDIDVLDYGGRRVGWPPRRRERGRLVLPHPEMHRRAFVLVPLLEIAPPLAPSGAWRRRPARSRPVRSPRRAPASGKALDFAAPACDKKAT